MPKQGSPRFVLAFLLSLPRPFGVGTRAGSAACSGTPIISLFLSPPLQIKYRTGAGNHWHLLLIAFAILGHNKQNPLLNFLGFHRRTQLWCPNEQRVSEPGKNHHKILGVCTSDSTQTPVCANTHIWPAVVSSDPAHTASTSSSADFKY